MLAIARAKRPLTSVPALTLEWLFWDVREWVRALPRDHTNVTIAAELAVRIGAEYARRRQETPVMVAGRMAAEAIDRILRRDAPEPVPEVTHHEPGRHIPFPNDGGNSEGEPS